MTKNTSSDWQQAALGTLLWLLVPVPEEAGKAYFRLLKQLVEYLDSRLRNRFEAEDLASQSLMETAEYIYRSLSDGQSYKVPPLASAEEHERARKGIPHAAFKFARLAWFRMERKRRLDQELLDPADDLASPVEDQIYQIEQKERVRRALEHLEPTDRNIIEKYYDFVDEESPELREQLANELGVSVSALSKQVARIRRKIAADLSSEKKAEAEFTAYFPESVYPSQWSTLLAYMHLSEALPSVDSDSKRRFGAGGSEIEKTTAENKVMIEHGAEVLVVPESY
jgi:DNA-directed RNA polymerase specialized sigma subunit